MIRRLTFFGVGAIISIFFLSLGPQNRLKNTFFAYIDYFNPDKRVITQLLSADSTIYFEEDQEFIRNFCNGAWINHDLSDKDSYPQYFVLDNVLTGKEFGNTNENIRVHFNFFSKEKNIERGEVKFFSSLEVIRCEYGLKLSKKSYKSYFILFGMFFIIMIPISLLIRNLIQKKRNTLS